MKLKVFLSSRNNDRIEVNGVTGNTLTEIRRFLKSELEAMTIFDKQFLEIAINEDFGAVVDTDSYNKCIQEIRDSDFTIALYNGAAGWAAPGSDIGICYAELVAAINISNKKTAIVDITAYYPHKGSNPNEIHLNGKFEEYVTKLNKFSNPLKLTKPNNSADGFKHALLSSIKNILYKHIGERSKIANQYFNIGGDNPISLDWKKLNFHELNKNIRFIIEELITKSPDFSRFITTALSIAANMSEEDAKSYTGRPFLTDQELILTPKFRKVKQGPFHFIAVYGSATESQVKKLNGIPDVRTMKEDFGIYVWDQNTHVQMVFLPNCNTPQAIQTNFQLFETWCHSNGEYDNMIKRAQARYHILAAMNEANDIVNNGMTTAKKVVKRKP
jgi:hypothetical protein